MRLRALIFLVPLLASEGSMATASEPRGMIEAGPPTVIVVPALPQLDAALPTAVGEPVEVDDDLEGEDALEPALGLATPLHEVHWTAPHDEELDTLASRWGLPLHELVALNPELRQVEVVRAGTRLRVYERDEEHPTRSIGSPNKGRLQHGLPMPEGPHWALRERRTRAFGTRNAVEAMITAFQRYGQAFDDALPVPVGELSSRRGGRAHPHVSHRTGRDVDLGYILLPKTRPDGPPWQWQRADEHNFDVERNWALIKALVDTGEVQQIFIARKLQRLLEPVARAELDPEAFARYFRVPGHDPEQAPILRHEDGHRDHMHVRFRCEPGNPRCRPRR